MVLPPPPRLLRDPCQTIWSSTAFHLFWVLWQKVRKDFEICRTGMAVTGAEGIGWVRRCLPSALALGHSAPKNG